MRLRLIDIARALKVSYTTVAVTLNGKADRYHISQATQARILAYAEKVGYVKDLDASGVAIGTANQIGMLFPSDPVRLNESQRALFFSLLHALHEHGMTPLTQPVDTQTFLRGVRNLLGKKVRDILVLGSSTIQSCLQTPQLAPLLQDRRLFLIDFIFNIHDQVPTTLNRCYRIGYDRHGSLHAMLKLLRDAGHRTVAIHYFLRRHLGKVADDQTSLALHDIYDADGQAPNPYVKGVLLLPQVMKQMENHGCTAVMLTDDMRAEGLISALLNAGMRVPEDISVVGFEGIPSVEYARVPLTTIAIPSDEIVCLVCDLLLQDTGEDEQRVYQLSCQIVERQSLGPAPRLLTPVK
jgi:DNA-binding LacI/PurR family transcriptional regulator